MESGYTSKGLSNGGLRHHHASHPGLLYPTPEVRGLRGTFVLTQNAMPPPYTPLNADKDEIRILTLLPGQSSDPIDCTLQVASLDDAPKYEALSYVWGDAVVQREVFVDGHPTNVTVSLETALRALRNEDKPRALWADAICMNQSDILEKNFQVPLMGRVYAEADSVLVWLGEPSPEVELVITCLSRPGVDQPELLSGLLSEMSFDDLVMFWEGLNQMITHKYWTRMWTYQEFRLAKAEPIIVLGRSVLYPSQLESGSKEVMDALESALDTSDQKYDRARFGKACRRLRWLFERSKTFAMVKNPLEQCTLNNQSPETLSQLLIDTCVRRSEDPRDHIYALYGLLPKVRQALPPDYGRLPRHIMHDSTMYVINENSAAFGALLRIYCLQGDRLSDCSVPSWVLNFASTLPIWDSPYAPPETIHHLSPSVGLTEQVAEDNSLEISDDGKLLFIRARSLGRCNVHFRFSDDLSEVASQPTRALSHKTWLRKSPGTTWKPYTSSKMTEAMNNMKYVDVFDDCQAKQFSPHPLALWESLWQLYRMEMSWLHQAQFPHQ
ncbi:HET-domain-containing protein [Trematosphaeria pertusa]|uniref:HET-domain-containing protein n=1 Tax=Trematosphaeria pertusa TaxID=390896 RepID=A0A6A6I5G3_9PLEO|nr:HET-domain-containing protein [Trematosphaeria pertusa]KAF2245288.1 HET-domain-containing protein [Trematosphaeria pertusa]